MSYDDSTLNLRTHIDAGTAFTHDSKYLLAGVHGGLSLPSHPTLKSGGVYIYPMSNLQQPSLSLETAHAPIGMALEPPIAAPTSSIRCRDCAFTSSPVKSPENTHSTPNLAALGSCSSTLTAAAWW